MNNERVSADAAGNISVGAVDAAGLRGGASADDGGPFVDGYFRLARVPPPQIKKCKKACFGFDIAEKKARMKA